MGGGEKDKEKEEETEAKNLIVTARRLHPGQLERDKVGTAGEDADPARAGTARDYTTQHTAPEGAD